MESNEIQDSLNFYQTPFQIDMLTLQQALPQIDITS